MGLLLFIQDDFERLLPFTLSVVLSASSVTGIWL